MFLPITRVTSLDSGQVITTGVLNLRKFEKRAETLAIHELFDRAVTFGDGRRGTVYDLSMIEDSRRDWHIADVAVHEGSTRFGRRGQRHVLDWMTSPDSPPRRRRAPRTSSPRWTRCAPQTSPTPWPTSRR